MGEWKYGSMNSEAPHYMDVTGQLYAPTALPSGEKIWQPLDRRLGGLQNRSGRSREEKYFVFLPTIEPRFPGRPARDPVTILTEHSKLQMLLYN
jgi:hypothetical protein